MAEALECDICTEIFSSGEHDPLVLQCGHSFCRSCVINMSSGSVLHCPNCRKCLNDIDIGSLPVNFKLLGLATDPVELQHGSCTKHGDKMTYWCKSCQLALCAFCMYTDHPRDHEMVKGKEFLEEKRRLLETRFQTWKKEVGVRNTCRMKTILRDLKNFYVREVSFAEAKKDITELLAVTATDITIECILDLESKIDSLMAIPDVPGSPEVLGSQQEEIREEACTSESPAVHESSMCEECRYSVDHVDGRRALVQWQGERLLMSTFCENSRVYDPVFKMPKEVFLEISIKETTLGLIIIRPWYHLRRAYQFTLLCIGTFGLSYIGSNFFRVHNKNRPQEVLSGGYYLRSDGTESCKDLITDLEWGGAVCGEAREGLVVTVSTLRDSKADIVNDASGFGICTRGDSGGIFKCPFGNVVSGLDVAKRAVQHENIREVIITRCGAVILDRDE